ncbi:MAG: class I SAM-dependent methyltransferase [Deltaproteobacteria bacterium]|nr:class I SAM-dependent methyltransferase [Deltaproteobacteria bacterium]
MAQSTPHGQVDPADYYVAAQSGSRAERTFHAARLRLLQDAANTSGRRVLDVGSGAGFLAVPLAVDGAQVTGVDLSPSHIAAMDSHADAAGVEVEGVVASAAALPFDDESFDVVYLASVVHLVSEPGALLREAERVCKRDGQLVVAGPWRFHPKSIKAVKRLLGKKVETTSWPFTVERVQRYLLRSRLVTRTVDRPMGYVVTVWSPDRRK